MKKKVILVTNALWVGGIETALINLLNYIDYDKFDVTLLTLQAIFDFDMKAKIPAACRVLTIDRERKHSYPDKYKFNRLYHLTEKSENPSLIHKLMMWAVPLIKWIENRLYIRFVRELMRSESFDTAVAYSDVVAEATIRAIHADRYLMFYHHGAMRHVYHDRIAYKKCEKIIAVSENQASELRKFVPAAANKIIAIHNLTDVEGIRKKAVEDTIEVFDRNKFNIVSVGRVSYEKGMDIAVHVCEKLVKDGFQNICWWIIGDGPAMKEVRKTVAQTNMEDHIILPGMKENPYPYIRQADLYVQPSRFEGYPMTILEALIIGQPVISTDNNGAKEIIQDGKTGLLCTTDIDKLADTVKKVLVNQQKLAEFRKNVYLLDFKKQNGEIIDKLQNLL